MENYFIFEIAGKQNLCMTKKEIFGKKIGKAAMQCFERYGLDKTTYDDIAKAVGLNKATLYYYYKNKEDIFIETAFNDGKEYIARLQEQALRRSGIEKIIWFYMKSRFNYYTNVLSVNHVSVKSMNKILPRFFELYDGMRKQEKKFLSQVLKKAIDDGSIMKADTNKIASALIDISDALKHSAEQMAIIQGQYKVDYESGMNDMKLFVSLVFAGLKKRTRN